MTVIKTTLWALKNKKSRGAQPTKPHIKQIWFEIIEAKCQKDKKLILKTAKSKTVAHRHYEWALYLMYISTK
jgi:hypothetical protein